MEHRVRRCQDDHCTAGSAHAPLRDHRNRQRQLPLQEAQLRREGSFWPAFGRSDWPSVASMEWDLASKMTRTPDQYWMFIAGQLSMHIDTPAGPRVPGQKRRWRPRSTGTRGVSCPRATGRTRKRLLNLEAACPRGGLSCLGDAEAFENAICRRLGIYLTCNPKISKACSDACDSALREPSGPQ